MIYRSICTKAGPCLRMSMFTPVVHDCVGNNQGHLVTQPIASKHGAYGTGKGLGRKNPYKIVTQRLHSVLRKTLESAPWEKFHHPSIEAYIEEAEEDWWYNKLCDEELEVIDIRTLNGLVKGAMGILEGAVRMDLHRDGVGSTDEEDRDEAGGTDDQH
ncbi:hypothetical protein Ao3042_08625 [Aspergillus oryzae 3.042]|uniref:Uncharacterized protein n=1 Tax=Aspergillus oryzae (strain 3.042) TaxID=1160506 RepID=I8TLM4_ASPO3|nr:hypothetical protein Ao3042_08625 [Aspergillus oryzae 3.042]|eukprot:EIT74788.1 hypothetical protein Ao3042_08625 [Aspergillus oryzae 3.042]